MRNVARVLLPVLVLILLVIPLAGCSQSSAQGAGELAPDLKLRTLDGQTISLKDLQGKVVILNFFATWCPPCKAEMPLLQQVNDEWSKKGAILFVVDEGEDATTVSRFIKANRYTMPVLLDPDGSTGARWGVAAYPTTFFIDSEGLIRNKVVGAFPNKAQIDDNIKKAMQQN